MNNYYTDCIKSIQLHIDQEEYEAALEKLYVELSMPYIPQDYQQVFEEMLHTVQNETTKASYLLHDIEDIKQAFLKKGPYSTQALNSLETLNLRPYLEDIKEILSYEMDDLVKRMVLLIALEQELKFQVEMTLDQEKKLIDTEKLVHPLMHPHYQKIYMTLHETLESQDPSFLKLCLDELNMKMIASFPNINCDINSDDILANVNAYMNRG